MVHYEFTSQGNKFEYDLPSSHTIVSSSYLGSLKKDREALETLRNQTKGKRFPRNASDALKTFLSVAHAAVPAFALTTSAYVLPLMMTAFLVHFNLFSHIGNVLEYVNCFPSASYLRERIVDQAADNVVWMADELDGAKVYISCDKGKSSL